MGGAEEERLESHVPQAPAPPPVKEKPRSPHSGRPHLSPEEIKDADRAAQKEKLHAELKKVLLLKGQKNSAEQEEPKMETSVKITEEKLRASQMVEVIVETEPQVGMSGINISGGGRDGLFISEIIKDSPAAKNLSVLQGDQIISARFYFENIKYEDALRIIQYAEQCKVSYCLKRTVPSSDVTISQSSGTVEVKGPKAKMPKMTIKSLTPVKKKKKKIPSEVKDSESSLEAVKGSELSAASMDIPPVDVEFSFPKFSKILKSKGTSEATTETKSTEITTKVSTTEQKRLKMKFPRLRVKDAAGAGGISVDVSEVSAKASDEVKMKGKSDIQVGVSLPKVKTPKVDVNLAKPDIEFSAPKIGIAMPQVGMEAKEEKVFKTPQLELDIPLTQKMEASEGVKVTGLSSSIKIPDVEIKMPVAGFEVEAPESKIIPSMSKVGICTPQLGKEQDRALLVDGRSKTEIRLPSVELAAPKLDVDLGLPKVEGSVEVETPDSTSRGLQIRLPKFSMSTKTGEPALEVTPPQVKRDKGKVSEDKIKTPQFGISLPKGKIEGDSPDSQKRSSLKFPSIDISAPKVDLNLSMESEDISLEPVQIPDVTIKMPKISPPKAGMKVKDAYAGSSPQKDVKYEKVEAESTVEIPDVTLKMPKIGLPKLGLKSDVKEVESEVAAGKSEEEELILKGPKIKLPSFGGFLVKERSEVDGSDSFKEAEGKFKLPSIKMPSVDISLPRVQDTEPSKFEDTDKLDKKAPESEGIDFKFKMPKVSLPKLDVTTKPGKPDMSPPKFGIHMPGADTKIKGDKHKEEKLTSSDLDISFQKTKGFDLSLTSPKSDLGVEKPKVAMKLPKVELESIAFDGQMGDAKVGIPSIKMPVLEIDAPSLNVDLNMPKVTAGGIETSLEDKETKFQMPKINIPKLSDVARDMAVELDVPKVTGDISAPHLKTVVDTEDAGVKMSLPKFGILLGKSTEVGEIKEKVEVKLPKAKQEAVVEDAEAKLKLPSVKLPTLEITTPKIPDVDISADIASVEVDVSSKEDLEAVASGDAKWKAPKFSFRKLGIAGSKSKKGEGDVKTKDTDGDTELAVKGPKMKMPKFGIVFPKSKQDVEGEVEMKTSRGKVDASAAQVDLSSDGKVKMPSVKLPSVDISAPKLEVDIALPKGDVSPVSDKAPEINIDVPDVKLNLPKFSMPKFGRSKGGDEETDIEKTKVHGKVSSSKSAKGDASGELDGKSPETKGKGRELKMKMSAIKMPSFGISRKDTEGSEIKLGVGSAEHKTKKGKTVAQDAKVSPESEDSNGKTSFIKMPSFKISSPKVKSPEVDLELKGSKENLQMPDVHVKVPEVELPSFSLKSDKTVDISLSKTDSKKSLGPKDSELHRGDKIKIPPLPSAPELQISVPCVTPDISTTIPKVEVGVSDADIKRYEGDFKIPKLPSIGVELDIGLPKVGLEHEADVSMEKSAKIKMPKVDLPKFDELETKVDLSGMKAKDVEYEGKIKGPKLRLPHVDISLPKVSLDEEDIPFIEVESKMQGSRAEVSTTEGMFSLPSVELPKMSTPKIRAPELELDISLKDDLKASDLSKSTKVESSGSEGEQHDFKLKMPKIKMPKFGGSMAGAEEGTVKADAKTSKTAESAESGIMGFKIKMPKLQVGSHKGKGGEDKESDHKMATKGDVKVSDHEDSDSGHTFKIKMPSFGISKGSTESGTEPLHPSEESGELKFKMPKITLPDVGFSGGEGASLESGHTEGAGKVKSITSSSIEDLELDVGLKMPKIRMPTIGLPGRKGDDDMEISLDEESEKKKSLFKMPDVELSTPKIKAHGEYEVDGAKLEHRLSKDLEGGDSVKKSSKIKHDTSEEDAEMGLKVKLPTLAVSLPKVVSGDVELSPPKLKSETKDSDIALKSLRSEQESDHHEGKKAKKNIFSLSKSKDKSAGLISSDLDTSLELDGPDLKIKLPKIKMKPSFGRSKGKGKGSEVNGGEEETDADSSDAITKSSKIKFPRLGFSSSKGHSGDVNLNGTHGHVNGDTDVSTQDVKVGKLKFPKVEFSSPYKGKEADSEMNLKLVKTEEPESKDEGTESSFSYKFKSPKIAFSGFKKKEKGEDHIISSSARTEMATMENVKEGDSKSGMGRISLGFLSSRSKGEYTVDNSGIQKDNEGDTAKDKSSKYKIPKLALNSKSEEESSKEESSQEGFKIALPQMSFTTHQEEQTTQEEETTLGFIKVTTTKQIKTETVTEKTLAI
ncbi:periaxin isoform X2 [Engystomops pustulosus]|uniref:periaxin isoform X2 n=1 Tax=Engystomops pustulosus TaxID=76066 RepID=UPI003AFB518F